MAVLVVPAVLGALLVQAQPERQAQPEKPRFEVASVRISTPADATTGVARRTGSPGMGDRVCRQEFKVDRSRVDIRCLSLAALIGHAFAIFPDRVAGPDWMSSTKFDIAAKMPEGALEAQVPGMLQSLLEERFTLVIHRGSKEETV
jgi:uncharacterized protein (TIGR03435 family)